jgi:hypothetical protein
LHTEPYFATFSAQGRTEMHDRDDRGRGRGFDSGGGGGVGREAGRQRTPDEEATERVYRVWQEVESASRRVEQLTAIVERDDWRTERDKLQRLVAAAIETAAVEVGQLGMGESDVGTTAMRREVEAI